MKKVRHLYDQFRPQHYLLDLVPDRESMTFSGSVVITGQKAGRPSKRLSLHQKDLRITKVHVLHHDKKGDHEVEIERTNTHGSYDELRIHAKQLLYPGKYTISIHFEGKISRAMNGMYPCLFTHDKVEKKLIATQFESHHAREVFPCIDEPAAKATFVLSLTHPCAEAVVSNTPVHETAALTDTPQLSRTTFEQTPIMSTYLLAFIYGEMGHLEAKTKDGVVVRTYATPDNVPHTAFALDCAVKILEFYNDYFGIKYPLAKCDMLALPDFASGAMENWGAITYREQAMLVDEQHTSLSTKQYVAMVVAHELAHQWFGNLVTMRWWTDLWLNEGFASWIEYMAVDHLFPAWKMWTQFIVDEQQQGLKLDALENTHPVEVAINHPDEIRAIFDTISYSKGSSVIHMLYNYLGDADFKAGLRYYLKKHSYKNTDTIDLWDALEEVSHKPVKDFMHAWTSMGGYPLVHALANESQLQLSQQRFYLNPYAQKNLDDVWPVALLSQDSQLPDVLTKQNQTIELREEGHIKLNKGQSGFYRVLYNASHLQVLSDQIKRGHLDPVDRLGILADSFETAKAGYSDTADALFLLDAYHEEDNNAVWDVIAGSLASVRAVMNDDDVRADLKGYTKKLIAKQLKRLGWVPIPRESHFDRLLRPTILGMASLAEEPAITKKALQAFQDMKHPEDVAIELRSGGVSTSLRNGGGIDPDIRGVVYGTAARHGGVKEYDKMLSLYKASTSSEEKLNLCAALCGFKQPELIARNLAMITTDAVRLQDVAYWMVYSFSNRYAKDATWKWAKDHWDWLEKELGNDLAFYRFPVYAARAFSDIKFLKEYTDFFAKHESPALERSIKQGIEIIQWQSDWRTRDLKTVKTFFSSTRPKNT